MLHLTYCATTCGACLYLLYLVLFTSLFRNLFQFASFLSCYSLQPERRYVLFGAVVYLALSLLISFCIFPFVLQFTYCAMYCGACYPPFIHVLFGALPRPFLTIFILLFSFRVTAYIRRYALGCVFPPPPPFIYVLSSLHSVCLSRLVKISCQIL